MGARCRQIDVAHAVTANLGLGDFNAAFLADHAAMLEALVLATEAFVVLDGAKNLGAEKTITLRLEGAVIDSLWFLDFAEGPRADLFGRGHADLDGIEMLIGRELLEQVE